MPNLTHEEKIKQMIDALQWQIAQDTNPKDKRIHKEALRVLREVLQSKKDVDMTIHI